MTLYELTDEYKNLLAMAEDEEVDEQTLMDTLEALDGEIEAKADGYAKVMAEMDLHIDGLKQVEAKMAARRKAVENKRDRLKAHLQQMMDATGKRKFKTELFSFSIAKNPASLVIDNEDEVPIEYWTVPDPVVDKKAVKEILKFGETLTWAHLQQTESLRIK